MEYQEMINLLDNTPIQASSFKTKNQVEINDNSRGTYVTNSQMKFKNSMLKSSLYDYSDAYILVSGTITVVGGGVGNAARATDRNKKQAILKNFALFTDCITEMNNTQVYSAKDLHLVMLMYNLIKYGNNYSKTSGRSWQYFNTEPNIPIIESE